LKRIRFPVPPPLAGISPYLGFHDVAFDEGVKIASAKTIELANFHDREIAIGDHPPKLPLSNA
jgi:hypothetical protein